MAKAKISKSQRIRNMLKDGKTPKEIAQACNVTPQVVYNIRYVMNKKGGIATLPKPKLTRDGIATVPRKRGRPRKVSPIVGPAIYIPKVRATVPVPVKEVDAHDTNFVKFILAAALVCVGVAVAVIAMKA